MKKTLITISFILISLIAFAQPTKVRSNNVNTNIDSSLFTGAAFRVPVFPDTLIANNIHSLDSCGKIIFTYNYGLWYRACSPKRWIPILPTSSATGDTAFWRTSGNRVAGYSGIPVIGTIDSVGFYIETNGLKRIGIAANGIQDSSALTILYLGYNTATGLLSFAKTPAGGGTTDSIFTLLPLSVLDSASKQYLRITKSGPLQDGYLSSTDWNTFNKKWDPLGNTGTNSGINYIGTTDTASLVFKVGGVLSGKLNSKFVSDNTSFGYESLLNIDKTKINSAFGFNSLKSTTSGDGNEAFGYRTLGNTTSGGSNSAMGHDALGTNITGSQNTGIGYDALFNSLSNGNTGIGYSAGVNLTTGNHNTFIGNFANSSSTISNSIAIGSTAYVGKDSSASYGDSSIVKYHGFGTAFPMAHLHNVGTVRLESLGTASSDTTVYKPLGRNSSGDVIPMSNWPAGGSTYTAGTNIAINGSVIDGNKYPTRYINYIAQNSFSSLTGYTAVGSPTYTISGGKILFTGTGGGNVSNISQYIKNDFGVLNECNTIQATLHINSAPGATSYGVSVGFKSYNVYGATQNLTAGINCATGANFGKPYIYSDYTGTVYYGPANTNINNGDVIRISLIHSGWSLRIFVQNFTQGWENHLDLPNVGGFTPLVHNSANPGFFHNGGVIGVDSFHYTIFAPTLTDIMFIGNSITYGQAATTVSNRWMNQVGNTHNNIFSGGGSDVSQNVVDRLPEIIAIHPARVILHDVAGNDYAQAISSAIWHANLITIRNTLVAAGIQVIWTNGEPRTGLDLTPVKTFIETEPTFAGDLIIDTWTTMLGTGTDANADYVADGTHPNDGGSKAIANAVNIALGYPTNLGLTLSVNSMFSDIPKAAFWKTANYGPTMRAGSGIVSDWTLFDGPGNALMWIPHGTTHIVTQLNFGAGLLGVRDPTQIMDINGNLRLSGAFMPNNDPGTSGYILKSQGAGTYPLWVAPSTLFPTWQQTLTAGSTLTGNNTITGANTDFTWSNIKNYAIIGRGQKQFLSQSVTADTTHSVGSLEGNAFMYGSRSGNTVRSEIDVTPDSIALQMTSGDLRITKLNSQTNADDSIMTYSSLTHKVGKKTMPPIVRAFSDLTAQTATTNGAAYTNGASDGSFTVSAYADITAVSAGVLTVTVTYTDIHSNARTATFYGQGTTTAGLSATGSSSFAVLGELRVKASTTITVVNTLTVGTATWDCSSSITQLR